MLVYARDGSAADNSADRVAGLDAEFVRRTGEAPTAGLIIVNDLEDSRLGNFKLAELLARSGDDDVSDEKRRVEMEKFGITVNEFALAMTLPIGKNRLASEPGFTEPALRQIQWAAATPSGRRVEQFGSHLIDGGIRAQNPNFFQRMLILPFMPLLHGIVKDAMNAGQDSLLYECLCNAQPGWSDERRKKEFETYEQQRMGEAVKSLKAATQKVTGSAGK